MTDDRRSPEDGDTPDGYFNVPEGRGQVVFHDEEGNPMTPEQFDRYLERRRRELGPRPAANPFFAPDAE